MCGELPCSPMHPGCKYSREWAAECLERYYEAQRLLTLRVSDWDRAVRELHAYDAQHGVEAGKLLRAEIKRQNQRNET